MNISKFAETFNVSDRTVSRHIESLETKYSIKMTKKQGRSTFILPEFRDLLQTSLEGGYLPETLSLKTPFEEPLDVEVLEPVESVTAITTTFETLDRGHSVAPLALKRTVIDTSAIDQQTCFNWQASQDFDQLLLQEAAKAASNLGDQVASVFENIMSQKIAESKARVVQSALGGSQNA